MEQIIGNAVEQVLDGLDLHYSHEEHSYRFIIQDNYADFPFTIVADEEKELLVVIGFFPVKVGGDHLDEVFKVINSINYRTTVGAFVIDPADGELSFRIAQNVDGGAVNQQVVRICLLQAISRLTDSYEEIMAGMFGGPRMNFSFSAEEEADQS